MKLKAKIKKTFIAILLISLSSCISVYTSPELPEHNGGSVNFKEYDMNNIDDLEMIIVMQNDIIKEWEKYYEEIKKLYKK